MRSFPMPLLLLCALQAGAAVRFTANTDHTNVVPGEQVTIVAELVSDKALKDATAPPVASTDAFDVVRTDQNSSGSTFSIQIINGKATQSRENKYQFLYVIVPKKAGSFVFPAVQVTIDNTQYSTQPIPFNAAAEPVKNPDIRVIVSVAKQQLYAGEQTIITFKIAQRANSPTQIDNNGLSTAVAAFEKSFSNNFSLSRLFSNQVSQGTERVGGEMCRTFSLRWALIPLKAGSFTISPVPFPYAEIRQSQRRNIDPFFDDFFGGVFGGGRQTVGRNAFSNQLTLRVRELPPPPDNFSGVIGRINLAAAVDPPTVAAGDAATLKVALTAATRPSNVLEVTVPKLPNCEIFTPEKNVNVDTTAAGIVTKKSYKFLLIPQQEGTLAIPPIELAYFDPAAGAYKTASTGALSIAVTPGKGGAKPQTRYLTQEEIREVGTDIRYIKTEVKLRSVSEKPYREPLFLLLYPLPLAIFLFALLYRLQAGKREANAMLHVRARALRAANRSFIALRKQGAKVQAPQFLGSVAETIERYISQKFDFPATGRTLEELKTELLGRSAPEQVVADLTAFIELLDSYRFGGAVFDEKSRSMVLDKTAAFLASLEKAAKKGGKKP